MVDGPTPLAMWDPRVPVLSGGMRVIDQGPSFLSVTSGPAASPEQTPHLFLDPLLLLMKLAGSSAGTQLELALCAHSGAHFPGGEAEAEEGHRPCLK